LYALSNKSYARLKKKLYRPIGEKSFARKNSDKNMKSVMKKLSISPKTRKRLSTIDEVDEKAELAKLATAEAEVKAAAEAIATVETDIVEVEAKIKSWKAAFGDLDNDEQEYHETAKNYRKYLEEQRKELVAERGELRAEKAALINKSASTQNAVTERKSRRLDSWVVSGRLIGSKKVKGVRRYVYSAASRVGAFVEDKDGDTTTVPHRLAIRYEKYDLVFRIVFLDVTNAAIFLNDLAPGVLGMDTVNIDVVGPTRETVKNCIVVRTSDYKSDDEPGSDFCSMSASTNYTLVEPLSDQAIYQSVEDPKFLRRGVLESAHLVHKSVVDEEDVTDDDNNRLALSASVHRMFDGRRNQHGYGDGRFPQIKIEPVDDTKPAEVIQDSKGHARTKTWVKISSFSMAEYETMVVYIKDGTTTSTTRSDGVPDLYTFVYVKDVSLFKSNLEWKSAETTSAWQAEWDQRPS